MLVLFLDEVEVLHLVRKSNDLFLQFGTPDIELLYLHIFFLHLFQTTHTNSLSVLVRALCSAQHF